MGSMSQLFTANVLGRCPMAWFVATLAWNPPFFWEISDFLKIPHPNRPRLTHVLVGEGIHNSGSLGNGAGAAYVVARCDGFDAVSTARVRCPARSEEVNHSRRRMYVSGKNESPRNSDGMRCHPARSCMRCVRAAFLDARCRRWSAATRCYCNGVRFL